MQNTINTQALDELRASVGDSAMIRILKTFAGEMATQVREIENCLSERDMQALARTAHTLKGTSLTFGVVELNTLALDLERAARSSDYSSIEALAKKTGLCIDQTISFLTQYAHEW